MGVYSTLEDWEPGILHPNLALWNLDRGSEWLLIHATTTKKKGPPKHSWKYADHVTLYVNCLPSLTLRSSDRKFTPEVNSYLISVCVYQIHTVTSPPPHGLQATRLLLPWHLPSKNTRVSCPFLLQGIFPTQELNLHLLSVSCVGRQIL